jgi:putative transposase
MTKLEFEELQRKFASSGMSLKSFLNEYGVATSSYYYWSKKFEAKSSVLPMAPISFKSQAKSHDLPLMDATEMPGVTLAFPNGVRAHFGRGSESVLMNVLTMSMEHVLS